MLNHSSANTYNMNFKAKFDFSSQCRVTRASSIKFCTYAFTMLESKPTKEVEQHTKYEHRQYT